MESYRNDPVGFIDEFPMKDNQNCNTTFINHINDNQATIICKTRQGGCTTSMLGYCLWFMEYNPGSVVTFVSTHGARRLDNENIYSNIEARGIGVFNRAADHIVLDNKSEIRFKILNTAIEQGIKPDLIVFDEFAYQHRKAQCDIVDQLRYHPAFLKCKVVLCSSTKTTTDAFYDLWISANGGIDPCTGIYIRPADDSILKPLMLTYQDVEHLQHMKDEKRNDFNHQYLCYFW